jgi:NADPH2:quinone reductase
MPDAMPFEHAVHFTTIYSTTYGALAELARLRPGEVLLVHGAGGATGLSGVEIGKALGATVIVTAGSAEKRATACAHGADHAIDYRNEDVRARVLELTGGRGADVVYDPVGGPLFDASIRCTAPEGRLIPIGFASGTIPQIPANLLLVKNLSVIGCYWGYYLGWGKTRASAARQAQVKRGMAQLFDWYVAGKIRPIVDATYGLGDFATAMQRVADAQVIGKVVLLPQRS